MGHELCNFDKISIFSIHRLANLKDVQLRTSDVDDSLNRCRSILDLHLEEVVLGLFHVLSLYDKLIAPAVALAEHGADGIVSQFYHL